MMRGEFNINASSFSKKMTKQNQEIQLPIIFSMLSVP